MLRSRFASGLANAPLASRSLNRGSASLPSSARKPAFLASSKNGGGGLLLRRSGFATTTTSSTVGDVAAGLRSYLTPRNVGIGAGVLVTIWAFRKWRKNKRAKSAADQQKEQPQHARGQQNGNGGANATRSAGQPSDVPGDRTSLSTSALSAGSNLLQKFAPINAMHAHLCGFHFYAGDLDRQIEAHHFCSHLNEDVRQCVIYDSDRPDARLIGVEYIISERLFKQLPKEEKKYWHSHAYEVQGAALVAPRLPTTAENALMKGLVNTYGKTVHLWQIDRGDVLPMGPPKLMMAPTKDGQLDPELIRRRDQRYGYDSEEIRRQRESLLKDHIHKVLPGADSWEKGEAYQFQARKCSDGADEEHGGDRPRRYERRPPVSGKHGHAGEMDASAHDNVRTNAAWNPTRETMPKPTRTTKGKQNAPTASDHAGDDAAAKDTKEKRNDEKKEAEGVSENNHQSAATSKKSTAPKKQPQSADQGSGAGAKGKRTNQKLFITRADINQYDHDDENQDGGMAEDLSHKYVQEGKRVAIDRRTEPVHQGHLIKGREVGDQPEQPREAKDTIGLNY